MSSKLQTFRFDDMIGSSVKGMVNDLPSPKNFSYFWNFGVSLGVFLGIQIISGMFLAMSYMPDIKISFQSIDLMMREVNYGWFVRKMHSKGASFFFLSMYIHIGRGLYYFSFYYVKLWITGFIMLILSMGAGFFGYVLPWGQMSYWAATVITNLFTVVPVMGNGLVKWLWGGFSVSLPTLNRFFVFHFMFPLLLGVVAFLHVVFLHETGSTNPLGIKSNSDKMVFNPYYVNKDLFSQILIILLYLIIVFYFPYKMIKTSNFIEANPLVTPEHMEPEWYLLTPYTMLRSVPNKVGGVLLLVMYFVVMGGLPFYVNSSIRGYQYKLNFQFMFFLWVIKYIYLTWSGSVPPEYPFLELSQFSCVLFFSYFIWLGLYSKYGKGY